MIMLLQCPVCFGGTNVCHNLLHWRVFKYLLHPPSLTNGSTQTEEWYWSSYFIAEELEGTEKNSTCYALYSLYYKSHGTSSYTNDTLQVTHKGCNLSTIQSLMAYWALQMTMVVNTTTVITTPTEISARRRICCGEEAVAVDRSCIGSGNSRQL